MSKKRMSLLMAMVLCFLFCGYPMSTTVYGAQDKVTEKLENLSSLSGCQYFDRSNLPDLVVTYKNEVCTVKNLPAYKHPRYGRTQSYGYDVTGSAGVFLARAWTTNSPIGLCSYYIVDTNKTPVTAKLIENGYNTKESDEVGLQWYADDIKILSNGVSAFLNYPSVILFRPDGTGGIKLDPKVPNEYDFAAFGVDYSAQSKQYAVMYGIYPTQSNGIAATKRAGVAIFDEVGKRVQQFLLDDLYCGSWTDVPMSGFMGHPMYYRDCKFSIDPNVLYAGGINPIGTGKTFAYYKINLKDESYTGISKLPESTPEIPFKIQYNKTGTYIYTKSGDTLTTLAFLDGDYIAASYSVNLDGSIQVIFVSDAKTNNGIHPMTK